VLEVGGNRKNLQIKAVVKMFGLPRSPRTVTSLVISINLFQFMAKADAVKIINNAVAGLKRGGLFPLPNFHS